MVRRHQGVKAGVAKHKLFALLKNTDIYGKLYKEPLNGIHSRPSKATKPYFVKKHKPKKY